VTAEDAGARLSRADRVVLRLAMALMRQAIRRLPQPERAERLKEWTGELYGPLTDDLRWWICRAWATVLFAAGQQGTVRVLLGARSQPIARSSRATGIFLRVIVCTISVIVDSIAASLFVVGTFLIIVGDLGILNNVLSGDVSAFGVSVGFVVLGVVTCRWGFALWRLQPCKAHRMRVRDTA
jgi:hypothetical protein